MMDYEKSVVPLECITGDNVIYELKDKKGRNDTNALRTELRTELGNYVYYRPVIDPTANKVGKYVKVGEDTYVLVTEDNLDRYYDQPAYDRVESSGLKGRLEDAENATKEVDERLNNKIDDVDEALNDKINTLDAKVERIHREQVVLAEDGLPKITDIDQILGNIFLVPATLPIHKGGKGVPEQINTYIEWVYSETKGRWEEVGNTEAYLKRSGRALKGDIYYDTRAVKWSDEDNDINVNLMFSPMEVLIPGTPSTQMLDGDINGYHSISDVHTVMPDISNDVDDHSTND